MNEIKIDMNSPGFQEDFFDLEKTEQLALIRTLKKIRQLSWQQLYVDTGLKWERIFSKKSRPHDKSHEQVYSFRFSQKYRATALREDDFIRLLTLHVDHDSAYQ